MVLVLFQEEDLQMMKDKLIGEKIVDLKVN